MSKRKRSSINSRVTIFDDSFQEAAEKQKKKLKKFKPISRCKVENNYVNVPAIDKNGNIIYIGNEMKTVEKNIKVNNCFLQGLDKETTANSVASIREWLNENIHSNLPVYLINGHSSFDPRLKFDMIYNNDNKRVTRRQLAERKQKEDEIRQYEFFDQLSDGMSIMRYDDSKNGENFFTTPQGTFIIETTPVSFDAACGTHTLRSFFRKNIDDNFNSLRNSFLSPDFNNIFYSGDSNSVRLIIPPQMSAFNKVYTFDDEKGQITSERFGILKFSQDMTREELINRVNDLYTINVRIDGSDDEILEKKKSVIYADSEMKNEIFNSLKNNNAISLQQIVDNLGPGIYFDFSCSGLVYKIYEKQPSGNMKGYVFDPDLISKGQQEEGRNNMVIYNILMDNFEELERQYQLHMQNIVQRDNVDDVELTYKLPDSDDRSNYLTTASMKFANQNQQLTQKRLGLYDPKLADTDSESKSAANVYFGGKKKRKNKKRKTRKNLPKLRILTKKNVRHHYKLKYSTRKRRMAINEGVRAEAKKRDITMKKAAISKKGRFNLLRMYRKNKNPKACRKITRDMRYMDKKYKLGKTKNICKKSVKKNGKKNRKKTRRR